MRETENAMNLMKVEIPFLPALLFVGSSILARVAVQGIEQGLLSAALEWSMKHFRPSRPLFSAPAPICKVES
jgi:hypothetical protein